MPAKDLGTKYTCWKCSAKFYDLRKAAPVCPKCGADPRESPALKAPPAERRRAAAKPVAEPELVDDAPGEKDLEDGLEEEDEAEAAEDEEEEP